MYSQLTFGAEYLRDCFEARANVYIPVGKTDNVVSESHMEKGLNGFDVELGGNLSNNLELYTSYYYFHAKDTSMPGGRLRGVYNINPNIKLLGVVSYDSERKYNYFAGIKLSASVGKAVETSGLERKMTQNAVRDIDIIVVDKHDNSYVNSNTTK